MKKILAIILTAAMALTLAAPGFAMEAAPDHSGQAMLENIQQQTGHPATLEDKVNHDRHDAFFDVSSFSRALLDTCEYSTKELVKVMSLFNGISEEEALFVVGLVCREGFTDPFLVYGLTSLLINQFVFGAFEDVNDAYRTVSAWGPYYDWELILSGIEDFNAAPESLTMRAMVLGALCRNKGIRFLENWNASEEYQTFYVSGINPGYGLYGINPDATDPQRSEP